MPGRFRPPMIAVAAALLALIAVLATLQYRWLGRISDAERERLTATLSARADAYAKDFDRELTLAYMLFQFDPVIAAGAADASDDTLLSRLGARYERWQATARYPKLIREYYLAKGGEGPARLQRFNPATHAVEPVEWPESLAPIRDQLAASHAEKTTDGTMVVRTIVRALWERIPAMVVPTAPLPLVLVKQPAAPGGVRMTPDPALSYAVLVLDREFIAGDMLPALGAHHFGATGEPQYQLAIVETADSGVVYRSVANFSPAAAAKADANAELFQV